MVKVKTNKDESALETTRLRLHPCRLDQIELAYDLWTNDHIRHFLFDDREISPAEARSFVEASLANFQQFGYGLWLVSERDRGCLIGFAGLLHSESEAPNLIYGVHSDFCGKGYATEAAGAVLEYALENLALPVVKADVDEPNLESVRVLEKLGLKRTGRAIVAGRPLVYFQVSRSENTAAK